PEQEPSRVHQEEVRVPESLSLDRPKDVGNISAGDATEDVRCGQAGVIEEVRDVEIGDVEITKAMEQVGSTCPTRASSTRDVELRLSAWKSDRRTDLCVKARPGDGGSRLDRGSQASK